MTGRVLTYFARGGHIHSRHRTAERAARSTDATGNFVADNCRACAPARVAEFKSVGGGTQTVMGIRQQSALAMGLTAAYSVNRFAGVELGGAWAFSDMKASPGLSGVIPSPSLSRSESARVLMGSAKLILNLMPLTERSALRLGVGPAIISRGGGAYKADDNGDFSGLTDFGGAISLCSRLPLTDFLSRRIRAENYM